MLVGAFLSVGYFCWLVGVVWFVFNYLLIVLVATVIWLFVCWSAFVYVMMLGFESCLVV